MNIDLCVCNKDGLISFFTKETDIPQSIKDCKSCEKSKFKGFLILSDSNCGHGFRSDLIIKMREERLRSHD